MLRSKAGLDVNVSDELLTQLKESEQPSLASEEQATLAAGFGTDDSVESITGGADAYAAELRGQSQELRDRSGKAYRKAADLEKQAKQMTNAAEAMMANVDPDNQEEYLPVLREYVQKLNDARDITNEARMAWEVGSESERIADSTDTFAAEIESNNTRIRNSSANGNFDDAVEALRWERNRQIDLAQAKDEINQNLINLANAKESDQQKILDRITNLREDEDNLKRNIVRIEKELATDPKKKEREALMAEMEQVEDELAAVAQEIKFETAKAEKIGKDEVRYRTEAEWLLQLNNDQDYLNSYASGALSTAEKEKIRASVDGLDSKISVLTIDDDETLALLSEEQRFTRNDIHKLEALDAAQLESGVEWMALKDVKSNFEARSVNLIPLEDDMANAYRDQIVLLQTLQATQQQKVLLKELQKRTTDPAQKQAIEEELSAFDEYQNELNSRLTSVQAATREDSGVPGVETVVAQVMPEYNQSIQKANNTQGNEIAKHQEATRVREDLYAKLQEELEVNEQEILAAESPEKVIEVSRRNEAVRQALQSVETELNDVRLLEAAYELDNIAIMESGEDSAEKLSDQIDLAEVFIAALEAEQVKPVYGDIVDTKREERIETDLEQTRTKLEAYRSDLQLTLQASSDPTVDINASASDSNDTTADTNILADAGTPETNSAVTQPVDEQPETVENTTESNVPGGAANREVLPADAADLIVALDPGYTSNWNAVVTEDSDALERVEAKIDLDKGLLDKAQGQMDLRVAWLDESSDPAEQDALQIEIQSLQRLITQKSDELVNLNRKRNELMPEEWAGDIVGEQEFNPDNGFTEDALYTESGSAYVREMLSTSLRNDSREVMQSDAYDILVSGYGIDDNAITNQAKIDDLELQILDLETQMESAEKSEVKKLDRKTEKLYRELADEDIRNARKLESMSLQSMEDQQAELDRLLEEHSQEIETNTYLKKRLDRLMEEVGEEQDQAAILRTEAAPEIDEIKQSVMYRQALAHELAAISNQQKAIEILTNATDLAAIDEDKLAMVVRGESLTRSDNTEEPVETEESSSVDADVIVQLTDEEESMLQAMTTSYSSSLDEKTMADADVVTRTRAEEMLRADYQLTDEEMSALVGDARWETYLANAESYTSKENAYNDKLEERNRMMAELQTLEANISNWNTAARNTVNEAERAGLIEEMRKSYAVAQVLYENISALDEELGNDEAELASIKSQMDATFSAATVETEMRAMAAELVAEEAVEVALPGNETTENTEAADDLASAEEAAENTELDEPVIPETRTQPEAVEASGESAAPAAGSMAMPRTAEDYRNFVYPEVLNAEVFGRMSESVYSASNPIPIDIELPSGIVYKVQVGAFRNAIPQDHFEEFAPIMGETVSTGITRYTVGLFTQFTSADMAKAEIRGLGYRDAFVVAFRDGKRIPLYEAREVTGEELVASNEGPRNDTFTASNPTIDNTGTDSGTSGGAPVRNDNPASQAVNAATADNPRVSEEVLADYYANNPDVAPATRVEKLEGLFFTVQVGVYSKPVSGRELFSLSPLNSELTDQGKVRYTTGIYNNIIAASVRKDEIRQLGIEDAFVTAYHNGKRISINEASDIVRRGGANVLSVTEESGSGELAKQPSLEYDVFIGAFANEVPSATAQAMLFLEEQYGIMQSRSGGQTIYFTSKVRTIDEARKIQQAFSEYNVDTQLRTFKDGVEVDTK
ncbi:MAG: hypothetical protein KDC12_03065 [Flavobacteriales bacterium]|nr:hypothetical protein [Flavobacteriales bacterium]